MSSDVQLAQLSMTDLASLIADGEVSPVEVTRNAVDRLERYGDFLGVTTSILADRALADARRAEREIRAGNYRGVLHGVIVCKLNCDEFAYHPTGATSQYGASRNPWNRDIVSGGSSGGTGAAVAAGLIYAGLGTDTGGSIRLPSVLCGLVGIKPTYGRVSLEGVRLLSQSFDTPGPMARNTRDAAVMLQAMADPLTETVVHEANRMAHLTGEIDAGLEGLRVGVPSNYFFDGLDSEIETIVRAAVDALVMLGGEQVQVELPSVESLAAAQLGILTLEAYHNVVEATGGEITRVNPTLQARLQTGMDEAMRPGETMAVALGRLRGERDDALASYRRATGDVDILAAPVLQRCPPRT